MREPQTLHCYCCKEPYERGHFRCCAPPGDTKAYRWREQFCTLCRKCPRHCVCEKREVETPLVAPPKLDMTRLAAILASPEVKEWMPYREPGEEG